MLTSSECAEVVTPAGRRRRVEVPQEVLDALAAAGWQEYRSSLPHIFRLWWSPCMQRNLTALPGGRYTLREFSDDCRRECHAMKAQWRFDAAGLLHWLEGHPESGR